MAAGNSEVSFEVVAVKPEDGENLIVGRTHFIMTAEDIYEAIVRSNPNMKFGLAFNEASGDRLIRTEGNDEELVKKAVELAKRVGAGHTFYLFIKEGWPITVLNALKLLPEIVCIECATANPVQFIVATTEQGRGIAAVIDGEPPLGVEDETKRAERHSFLRKIGYKK